MIALWQVDKRGAWNMKKGKPKKLTCSDGRGSKEDLEEHARLNLELAGAKATELTTAHSAAEQEASEMADLETILRENKGIPTGKCRLL